MKNSFFKNLTIFGFVSAGVTALVLFVMGHGLWSLGVLASTSWIFLNNFFLFQLIEIGMSGGQKKNDKVLVLSVLKFPLLYVVAYFILKTKFFPIYSILLGLTVFMVVFTFVWFKSNLSQKISEGRAL